MATLPACTGEIRTSPNGRRVEAEVHLGSKRYLVYFQSPNTVLTGSNEVFLTSALIPCLSLGARLVHRGEVSPRLLQAIPRIVDLLRRWYPALRPVAVEGVVPAMPKPPSDHRVGTFFSAGVDSFCTLLTHEAEITDLIFVHGFDIPLRNRGLHERALQAISQVGTELGKRVVEVETNLRVLLDPHAEWGELAHGAALAAVGHLLGRSFRCIYIPATHVAADSFPWGSHPDLDALWSTETLEFVHDGAESRRVDKVARIAGSDLALGSLRVCVRNPGGAYNCCRCEKCLRTMINLYAAGALDRCTTFPEPLDPLRVARIEVLDDNTRAFVQENLNALESRGGQDPVGLALRQALVAPRWRARIKRHFWEYLRAHPDTKRLLRRCYRLVRKTLAP